MTEYIRTTDYYEKFNCDAMLGKLCRMRNGRSPVYFLLVHRSLSPHYPHGYFVLYDDGKTYNTALFRFDEIEEVPQ